MIKHLALILPLALSGLLGTSAWAAPPSEASIDEMLSTAHAADMIQTLQKQMGSVMSETIKKALADQKQKLNPKQQEAVDRFVEQYTAFFAENMTWEKFRPLYVRLYQETFTQEDVDGILSFYKTTAGQALINKMPLLMSKVMGLMPELLAPIQAKIKELQEQLIKDLKAAS